MGLDMYLNLKQYKEGKTFEQHKKLVDLFWRYAEAIDYKNHFENECNRFLFEKTLIEEDIALLVLEDKEYKEDFNCPLDDFVSYGAVTYEGVKRRCLKIYEKEDIYYEGTELLELEEVYKKEGFITLTNTKEIVFVFFDRAKESVEYFEHHLKLINKEISELKGTQDYEILLELLKDDSNKTKKFEDFEELIESLNQMFVEREIYEFMYWRKAHHIHHWMVENIQNGENDCEEYHLNWEMVDKLIEDIELVLANKELANDILPTNSNFLEYDEHYFQELESTLNRLNDAKEYKDDGYELFYDSSW